MSRTNEPVTVGVPLPDQFVNVSSLGLIGPSYGQFRALSYYPSGNVHWVLVDFLGDVGSSVTLNGAGSGNFGSSNLATDNGSTISISTGVATFRIRKANFNVFDSVTVGASTLVSAQTGELAIYDTSDVKYSSINDAASTAVIEENGPVRCCIKVTGEFKNAGGTRFAAFTMRMHFHRDKSFVRATYTLRNDDNNYIGPILFHALEATVPLAITSPTATLAKKASTVTQALTGTQHATVFQAFSTNLAQTDSVYDTGTYDPPLPYSGGFTSNGLEIIAAGSTLNALGDQTDYTQGFADLSNASGVGCTVALRWMSAYWPAGFDLAANGNVSIELFSKRNPKTSIKLHMCKHEWREILWDFHITAPDANAFALSMARLEAPLLARAPWQHYVDTAAIYGQSEFVTLSEQSAMFNAVGHPEALPASATDPGTKIYRCWAWGAGGGTNQIDEPLDFAVEYLRGGDKGYYYRAYARNFFNKTAVQFSLPGQEALVWNNTANDPNYYTALSENGGFFNAEHFHMLSLPFFYFLTGNEEYKEAVDGIRRWRLYDLAQGAPDVATNLQWGSFRSWCRALRNVAVMYEFGRQTNAYTDATLIPYMRRAVDMVIDGRAVESTGTPSDTNPPSNDGSPGRSMQRGFLYFDWDIVHSSSGGYSYRTCHALFCQIFNEAIYQAFRVFRAWGQTYRDDEFEDFFHGYARYLLDEFLDDTSFAGSEAVTDAGFIYDYAYDYPYPVPRTVPLPVPYDSRGWNDVINLWPYEVSRAAVHAYKWTGDANYLTRSFKTLWRANVFQNSINSTELQDQAGMAARIRPPNTWKPLALTVTPSGNDYILTWSQPSGAARIRIKTSTKAIVDWLGYNRVTQTYTYPPTTYVPWFAATDVANVPIPSAGSMTISGLPAGSNFSAKWN